jgi:hypothetical protein
LEATQKYLKDILVQELVPEQLNDIKKNLKNLL